MANSIAQNTSGVPVGDGQGGAASANAGVAIASVATPASIAFGSSAGVTSLVSVSSAGVQNGSFYFPSISADGRYVTFTSNASNLVAGDTDGFNDIFVWDRQTGTTTRVSVSTTGGQANNSGFGHSSVDSSISADGRYVTFSSSASNLVAGDTSNGFNDIFVRDLQTGTTTLVSVSSSGVQVNANSYEPSISANGRYVVFSSDTPNFGSQLVAGDDKNGSPHIFVRDLQTGTTTLVSVSSAGVRSNFANYEPSISADGRYVTFTSNANNLVAGDTNGVTDIFVRDLQTGTTTRVSASSASVQGNSDSYGSSISADGRYVTFYSVASNLVAGDTNGNPDIFVRDLQTGTTTRVSVSTTGVQGNSGGFNASISADGRYVTFTSFASNLVAGDTNGTYDVFVRDLQAGTTTLVSASSAGGQGNGGSDYASISADGRYVTFYSVASNLVAGDTNGTRDIFVRELRPTFSGIEDGAAISLPITITPAAGETVASVVLSGLPSGSVLSDGISSIGGTTWTFAGAPPANLTLTPPANYNGSFTLTVTATTGDGASTASASATATQTVTVSSVSDAPVAVTDTVTTSEDTSVTIDVLANDADVDGDALSVTQIGGQAVTAGQTVTLAGGAQATLNANGTITYAPAANTNGEASFGYTVADGQGGTASASVGVTVSSVNDAPVGSLQLLKQTGSTTTSDVVRGLQAADVINPSTQFYWDAANGGNGHIYEIVYSPGETWAQARADAASRVVSGISGYLFTATSAGEEAAVEGRILGMNGNVYFASEPAHFWTGGQYSAGAWRWATGPEAGQEAVFVDWYNYPGSGFVEATQFQAEPNITINMFNRSDIDGKWYSIPPAGGSYIRGHVVEFSGLVSETVTTTVPALPAIAPSDFTEDRTLYADASLISDEDGLGEISWQWQRSIDNGLTWLDIAGATAASYALGDADAGNLVRVAGAYTDGLGTVETVYSQPSSAVINVNDAPLITSGDAGDTATVFVSENTTAVATVMAADPDANTNLSYSIAGGSDAALFEIDTSTGALSFKAAPNFEAAGDADANNVYDVVVQVSDGTLTDTQAIAVTVNNANDAPFVSGAVTGAATEDGAVVTLNALANASDVDIGDTLEVVGIPASLPFGVTYDAATRAFTIDPTNPAYQSLASGATTTVTLEYGVSDGSATTPASVSWTVTGTNDVPAAVADSATTSEGTAVTIDVLANDTDVDGDTLSVTQIGGQAFTSGQTVTLADGAQATLNPDGTITYAPGANVNGAASFGYTVSDGQGGNASTDVGVTIAPVATPASIAFGSGVTSLVSVSFTGEQANANSGRNSISADGRYVAFGSDASNLVAGDANGVADIFVRDLQTGITTLVSASSTGEQGNSYSYGPSISADGRYLTFFSVASNLVAGDTNGTIDVFVRDLQTGTTTRVSASSAGEQGNGYSYEPSISADGRYVTFWSDASNLVAGDANVFPDIFVRDLQTGTTTLASASSAGEQGNSYSVVPSISADGRYLTFYSNASNLVAGDTNGIFDIFVRDLQTGTTTRVSVSTAGEQGNGYSYKPSISADGRYVTFWSDASNLVPDDANGVADIFVRDLQTGTTTLVSASSTGEQGNSYSYGPSISADGRYLTFFSDASNLVAGDANVFPDIFVRDLQTGTTTLISASSGGEQGNGYSYEPSISADGRYLTFTSYASNLVAGDANESPDIFVRDLRASFSGIEDGGTIPLPVIIGSASGDMVQQVVLSGLPSGSLLSAGTSSNGGTTWTFAGAPSANLTLKPPANYNGSFTLTVTATTVDGGSTATATATQTVTVSSVNDAPLAVNDAATTSEGTSVTIDVLANDTDVDGDTLSVTQIDGQAVTSGQYVTLAGGAQAILNADGTITYAPAANANGAASFGYTVSDGQGGTASATVGVTIAAVATPASISFGSSVGVTSLVSVSSAGEPGNGGSYRPSISADGRYVTFGSDASNLVAGDTDGTYAFDIFVRDLQTGTTTLVSASTAGERSNGASVDPSISADGRYVTFYSNATNLVAGDTNGTPDIFLRDLQTGTTTLISASSGGEQGSGYSYEPAISADGRYVTFYSNATNLVAGDTNGTADIFVRDLQTGTTTLASASSAGEQGNDSSYNPSISTDGRYVTFASNASNLVAGDTNGTADIFVRDLQTGTTTLVSTSSASEQGDSDSYEPSISGDGRYVAFRSYASNLVADDTNGAFDIFVRDLQTGTTTLASASPAGQHGNGESYFPSISADGRYVTFASNASNLVAGDTNGIFDIFVRDLQTGTTTLLSASSGGQLGNELSNTPSISADGRYLTFTSYASNLVAGDANRGPDIFVRELRPGFWGIQDGGAISLPITIASAAGDMVQQVVLSGLPSGSLLSEGISSNGGTTWTFAGTPPSSLNLTPPANYNGSFTLSVTATTVDGASTATTTATQTVRILPETIAPTALITDDVAGAATGNVTYQIAFSEAVTGLAVDDFTVTNGSVVSVSGTGQSYSVTVAPAPDFEGSLALSLNAAAVLDKAGNANAAVNADAQTVDTRKPVVSTITPAADSTGVLVATNISLAYSEAVRAGAGVIELLTAAGTLVESFNVATSNRLTIAGSTITIDPTASLNGATQYRLTVPQGAVLDAAGNAAAALGTYAFTTQSLVNIINGTSAANTLNGTAEDDEIYGFGGNDTLNGNAGNDLLDGGSGADRMTGGAGDDIYVVDNASDVVTEAVNGGIDLIRTNRATYTLANNFENLAFIGDTNFTGTGNAAANSITGGIGNDRLDGRAGNDIMAGGAGNDQYEVDSVGDVVIELASQGTDTVTSSVSYTLSANIENLILSGNAGLSGAGNASANQITGNSGANTLRGAGGADALNGGGGTDTAVFDQAAASYELDHSGSAVIVSDLVGGEGTDTLTSIETLNFAGASYAIVAGTGTANTLNGGAGSQAIFGLGGNDTINGGAGNDIIIAGLGNDAITLASDTGGRDFIDGGAGEDTFTLATAAGAEAFVIYTRLAALQAVAGLALNPNTEIVITRNGLVIAELDNVEEIIVSSLRVTSPAGANGGTVSGDTIQVVGDFNQTSLNFNTITINGTQANDVVDISALESAHRIVFTSNGGQDTVIGSLRPQDIVNMGPAASSSAVRDGHGFVSRGELAGDAIEVSGDFRMFGMSDGIEAMSGVPTNLQELAMADSRDEGFGRTIIGMEDLLLDLVGSGPVAPADIAMPIVIDTDSFFDHLSVLTDYPVS